MDVHVLLYLLNELRNRGKIEGLPRILSSFKQPTNALLRPSTKCRVGCFAIKHVFFQKLTSPISTTTH